jgi:hypothetical protein
VVSVMAKDPKEDTKKCNQEIQASLNKYNCRLVGNPVFNIEAGGYLKVVTEIKIVPVIKLTKPVNTNGKPKYIN